MKCYNCGLEYEDNLKECPNCNCGTQTDVISLNPAADRVSAALKDGLFLTLCILFSATCVLGLLSGTLPVLNILFTIFLWLAFAQARKGMLDSTHLRSASGTVFAMYVINYVLAGLIAFLGIILSVVFAALSSSPEIMDEVMSEIELNSLVNPDLAKTILSVSSGVIMILFIMIAALVILFNIFGIRKIHKFAQSVYTSIDMNNINFISAKAAKIWLFVLGGLSLLTALGSVDGTDNASIFSALTSLCDGLASIFAGVLIAKYLND